jgi:hypothetical protein
MILKYMFLANQFGRFRCEGLVRPVSGGVPGLPHATLPAGPNRVFGYPSSHRLPSSFPHFPNPSSSGTRDLGTLPK